MKFKYIKTALLVVLSAGILTTSAICIDRADAAATQQNTVQQTVQAQVPTVSPLAVVNSRILEQDYNYEC